MVKAIQRMEKLAEKLKSYKDAQCLLGLGSMSQVRRADNYSDMDFFLIVKEGSKQAFLDDLKWLSVRPLVYIFRNTLDGYKVLFDDGVFAEFAVFTEKEIIEAQFTKGIVYYKTNDFDVSLVTPKNMPKQNVIDRNHHLNEALTNIYIGLNRLQRGEVSSATTFIQNHAFNNILRLFDGIFKQIDDYFDPYVYERRIEFKYTEARDLLPKFRQGYDKNKESALEMIQFLAKNYEINAYLLGKINELLEYWDK